MPLRSLELSWASLLAAMHRVHVMGERARNRIARSSRYPTRIAPAQCRRSLALVVSEATFKGRYSFLLLRNAVKRRQNYVDPGRERVSSFDLESSVAYIVVYGEWGAYKS